MSQWGPQPAGSPNMQFHRGGPTPGLWALIFISWPLSLVTLVIFVVTTKTVPDLIAWALFFAVTVPGFVIGRRHKRDGVAWYGGADGCLMLFAILFSSWFLLGAYTLGYALRPRGAKRARAGEAQPEATQTMSGVVMHDDDPQQAIQVWVRGSQGRLPGAVLGWTLNGKDELVTAVPRGGVLVMGPPGSGKTSAVLIPTVLIAPGACVSSSVKADVMLATAHARQRVGQCWHFDPGGNEVTPHGVTPVRWSPLVGVSSWDSANTTARSMAETMRSGQNKDDHFIDRAQDWLAVLLYAAHVGKRTIADVANWAAVVDAPETVEEVGGLLEGADDDGGAGIAQRLLLSLTGTPDRERGSIASTLNRMLKVYNMVGARKSGQEPNFDPEEFVRSADTLYLTAAADVQEAYAPLLAGLLEQIRFATYRRHKLEEAGSEPRRPHVTFALDEADKTAPIPLPQIISEAGGQSLHLAVGLQSVGLAVDQWGKVAESFLTLFPAKVIFRGTFDEATVRALSDAAGKYDRQMESWSQSVSYVGPYAQAVQNWNPSYSVQREQVLTPGDITAIPEGRALVWIGPDWTLLGVAMHWSAGVWRTVIDHARANPTKQLPATKKLSAGH